MNKKQRRLLLSVMALAVALLGARATEAAATPSHCYDIAPFCDDNCSCPIAGCVAECDSCGAEYVWCMPEE